MQEHETQGMWWRYVLFLLLAFGILGVNLYFNPPKPRPPQARPQVAAEEAMPQGKEPNIANDGEDLSIDERTDASEKSQPGQAGPEADQPEAEHPHSFEQGVAGVSPAAPEPGVEQAGRVPPKAKLVTLGSQDPNSPYRSLVTLTNLGAAVVTIELNNPRYRDQEDRSGYLGRLCLDDLEHLAPAELAERLKLGGVLVDVVGPGTPAAEAGLAQGDVITAIDGQPVTGFRSFRRELGKTRPGQTVQLAVLRQGRTLNLSARLRRRPLEVVRPEKTDPLSFLFTMRQIDGLVLDDLLKNDPELKGASAAGGEKKKSTRGDRPRDENINLELAGLDLRTGAWDIEDAARFDQPGPHASVTFFRELPKFGLKISKTYRLVAAPEEQQQNPDAKAYHLFLDVKIENIGQKPRQVAYQLDGPTGLPVEGAWYAYKVGRGGGLRDVVVSWEQMPPRVVPCYKIARDDWGAMWGPQPMSYVGVDAQYFSAVMIPQMENPADVWFAQSQPMRVGAVDRNWEKTTNTSFRLVSKVHALEPGAKPLQQSYMIFAGPKKPPLLAQYRLKDLLYYGWFWWVAIPMLWTLHVFYAAVGNYGLAIIMLTVLVRGCMVPLSIRQQRGALKMQELQPELKRIQEQYKNNAEAKVRAQQELFKKHNYNPLGGCLIVLLQLPIFIGLYRGLSVDVELRQAPLISESIRWCSNLAAPDMLYDWSWFWNAIGWTSVNEGLGLFGLGPYFNLLPILTVAFMLVQQKMLMPPPTDEQQAVQQKVMKYMMIFMGFLFYKVASGLCLYFIASSMWGLAERKLLPKAAAPGAGGPPKPPEAKPVKPTAPRPARPAKPGPSWLESLLSKAAGIGSNDGATRPVKKRKRSRGKR